MGNGDVLKTAHELINKNRNNDYGDSYTCFNNIATLWSAYLDKQVTPKDVCIMMSLLKIGREKLVHKDDNFVDAVGYLGLADDLFKREHSETTEEQQQQRTKRGRKVQGSDSETEK